MDRKSPNFTCSLEDGVGDDEEDPPPKDFELGYVYIRFGSDILFLNKNNV